MTAQTLRRTEQAGKVDYSGTVGYPSFSLKWPSYSFDRDGTDKFAFVRVRFRDD